MAAGCINRIAGSVRASSISEASTTTIQGATSLKLQALLEVYIRFREVLGSSTWELYKRMRTSVRMV